MANKEQQQTLTENMTLELRRGVLVLAVLSQLQREAYGYSLKQALAEQGLDINEGTLYPLLRRLEKQGLLESDWRVVDDKRPRRYYRLSQLGQDVRDGLLLEWTALQATVERLLNPSA